MAVLWCGGEDIDFQNGQASTINTTNGHLRAAFARCAVNIPTAGNVCTSGQFAGGAVTTAWITARIWGGNYTGGSNYWLGFGLFGTNKGLFVGSSSASGSRVALNKFDGTTVTQLATESGNSMQSLTLQRIDMQVVSYGASATVTVYIDGLQVLTFTGDVTVSGMTNFDCVALGRSTASNPGAHVSEVIVATDDVRAWPGLMTLALTGAGTTNNWTNNTFSNVNGVQISDTNPTSDNTNGDKQEYDITNPVTGSFTIPAIKIAARMAKSASPAVNQVALGYNSGGSVAYGTGATKALTTAYATYEQLDTVNPITSAAFAQSDMNALQLDIKAVT